MHNYDLENMLVFFFSKLVKARSVRSADKGKEDSSEEAAAAAAGVYGAL